MTKNAASTDSRDPTEPQRRFALLTADALLRHVERGDWEHIETLARSLLRTAVEARALLARQPDQKKRQAGEDDHG